MKHYHYFDDEITVETVNNLINTLCENNTEILYFSTNGGENKSMEMLVDFLNLHTEIQIIITDQLMSCGTMLLTDYKGKLKIAHNLDMILFHATDQKTYNVRDQYYSTKEMLAILKEDNAINIEKYRQLGLTEKELKLIEKGKDVIYYRKDFPKLRWNLPNLKQQINEKDSCDVTGEMGCN